MEKIQEELLLPATTLAYYADIHPGRKLYINATSIRYCIENLCDVFLVYFAERAPTKSWLAKTVSDKLKILKNENFFPEVIYNRLKRINEIGTSGAHVQRHNELNLADVEVAIKDLGKVCEWTLLQYFLRHGFHTQHWVLTIFSTLPPKYRLSILDELFREKETEYAEKYSYIFPISEISPEAQLRRVLAGENTTTMAELVRDEFVIIIDKLSMAFLKSGQDDNSIAFLKDCYDKGYIDKEFFDGMFGKINELKIHLDEFPISKDLEQARQHFREVLPAVKPEEYSLFLVVFSAIVAQEDVDAIKKIYDALKV